MAVQQAEPLRPDAPTPVARQHLGPRVTPTRPSGLSFEPVGAIQRGIEVLRSLARVGIGNVAEIHAATGIPKPTIVRVLETLIVDGYVARDSMASGYYVTSKVSELCPAAHGMARIIETAKPYVIELTERLLWPVNIGSLVKDELIVQYSTAEISPWSRTIIVGKRTSLYASAMGVAYLAFCAEPERRRLLALAGADDGVASDGSMIETLDRVRQNGFATRPNSTNNRISGVAVPLILGHELAAVMTCHYFHRAVSPERAVADIVPALIEARDAIQRTLEGV